MIRIALIGGTNKPHAKSFSTIFNSKPHQEKALADGCPAMPSEARVTVVWDENPNNAAALAQECGIERVASLLGEALTEADAVIIPDDCSLNHQRWARPVMEAGKPFFLDKPMSPSAAEARSIIELAAQQNAKMMSSSALRYARELETVLPAIRKDGGATYATAWGPNGRFVFYGIHPVELTITVMGCGVSKVENFGRGLRNLARFTWRDGREAVVAVDERARGFGAVFHTQKGAHSVTVTDSRYFYWNLMRHFLLMVTTGELPVPWEETLEIIRLCEEAERLGGAS